MIPLFSTDIKRPKGLSCVSFHPDGIAFAHIESCQAQKVKLKCCDFLPCPDFNKRTTILAEYVKRHKLAQANCACVLKPSDYRLLLLDAPKVPPKELKQATKFLIKDLINFPIEEAAVDTFEVPLALDQAKVYVVVARMKCVSKLIQVLEGANLNVQTIDIAELALRNLIATRADSAEGIALLFLGSAYVHTMIEFIRGDQVHLVRRMGVTTSALPDGEKPIAEEKIALTATDINADELEREIQNSFDYYQNRLGQALPAKILISPFRADLSDLATTLSNRLSMPVEILDLNDFVDCPKPLSLDLQAKCLTVIGESFCLQALKKSQQATPTLNAKQDEAHETGN